jgi:hypothetical protein
MGYNEQDEDLDMLELEIEYKRAVILLAKQIPELIREMQLLRGAIDRIPPRRY